jgi:hypothetical protein
MKKPISSEWLLTGSLFFIIVTLILVAKVNAYRAAAAIATLKREEVVLPGTVSVWVCGAVKEAGEITLPAGSRISDLKGKVTLSEEADKSFFRRRRKLKNGEAIEVPKKTVENNLAPCL